MEVRTKHGSWRAVACVYSEGVLGEQMSLGTTRLEMGGRYTILELDQVHEWRLAE